MITFELNGAPREARVASERLLIDFLRDDLGLTGTKEGCSIGVCGACSVQLDGEVVSACLVPAVFVDRRRVVTVEGLANGKELSKLQQAFIEHGGFQCGICTPGQLITADALLRAHPRPSDAEAREWMMGNLCRCTGYEGILRAIQAAATAS